MNGNREQRQSEPSSGLSHSTSCEDRSSRDGDGNLLTPCSSFSSAADRFVAVCRCVCVCVCWSPLAFTTDPRRNHANMADTARNPRLDHSGFQELEDGEDLFPEPAVTQEVRRGRWWIEAEGEQWQAGRDAPEVGGLGGPPKNGREMNEVWLRLGWWVRCHSPQTRHTVHLTAVTTAR